MDEEDVEHESADDALEDTRAGGMFHPDSDEEKLPQDYDSPAAPYSRTGQRDDSTDPLTDDDLDDDEVYSEGLEEAAGLDDSEEDSDDEEPEALDPSE